MIGWIESFLKICSPLEGLVQSGEAGSGMWLEEAPFVLGLMRRTVHTLKLVRASDRGTPVPSFV